MEKIGLYIHFPFCSAKCSYCHFYSLALDKDRLEKWLEGLGREAAFRLGAGIPFETLYIGGGTPSLLGSDGLFRMLDLLKAPARLDVKEFTLEANPELPDENDLRGWKEAGVDRLSIGVQSFDDRVLGMLERRYTARQAEDFIGLARQAGFDNISLDLMIGVPGETRIGLEQTLKTIREASPEHVSLYMLENYEGLPFESVVRHHPLDEDAAAEAYDFMRNGLENAGLARYEISNFARPGKECRHNLKYWAYEPFIGLGPSACSHIGAERWCNASDLELWASALERGDDCHEEAKFLGPEESFREALIFGLRLTGGISLSRFKERFGEGVFVIFQKEIRDLQEEGLILLEGDRLRIPEDKFLISNAIFCRFI